MMSCSLQEQVCVQYLARHIQPRLLDGALIYSTKRVLWIRHGISRGLLALANVQHLSTAKDLDFRHLFKAILNVILNECASSGCDASPQTNK